MCMDIVKCSCQALVGVSTCTPHHSELMHVQQVFEINPLRAWGAVATTVISVALSVYLISISPTYLLPLAWAFAGTAWTGVSCSLCCLVACLSDVPTCEKMGAGSNLICTLLPASESACVCMTEPLIDAMCCEEKIWCWPAVQLAGGSVM